MEWLRTQITMTEVNIARVHNYAVLKMQQRQAAAGAGKVSQIQPEQPLILRLNAANGQPYLQACTA